MDEENILSEAKDFVQRHWKIIAIMLLLIGLLFSLMIYLSKEKGKGNK